MINFVCRKKQTIEAIASVGMEGGFYHSRKGESALQRL
jgi:hypothetical protein